MNKKLMILLVIFTLALALTACEKPAAAGSQAESQSQSQSTAPVPAAVESVIAEGNIKPSQSVNLSFQVRGTVEEVTVRIGATVRQGDVLARLSSATQAEAQLAAANLELTNAQQSFDTLLRNGPANLASTWDTYMKTQAARADAERAWENLNLEEIEDTIEEDKAELEDLAQDLQDAQDEFEKYKDLDEDNSKRKTAEDDLEVAQDKYNEAVRKLEEDIRTRDTVRAALDAAIAAEAESKYQYELSEDGANEDQLALAQARLDSAKAQVAAAESNLFNYVLFAPFDGIVANVAVEIGEQVGPESQAVSVVNTSSWIIETTDITELEVVKVAVGQKVTFTADALNGVTMEGVVIEISQAPFLQNGDVVYTVRIAANDVDPRVKWGMTVEVKFEPVE